MVGEEGLEVARVDRGSPPLEQLTDLSFCEVVDRNNVRVVSSKAKFAFASDDAGARFECKLKGRGLKPAIKQFGTCGSPRKYKGLAAGRYRFQVRAIDAAGNIDPTPAKDRFRVV